MRKFKIDFETIKYPLIIMLMMSVLKGISNTILSDAVAPYIGSSYQWLIGLMGIMQYFSSVVIQYLPFIFIIMYLVKTYRDQRIIVMFFCFIYFNCYNNSCCRIDKFTTASLWFTLFSKP